MVPSVVKSFGVRLWLWAPAAGFAPFAPLCLSSCHWPLGGAAVLCSEVCSAQCAYSSAYAVLLQPQIYFKFVISVVLPSPKGIAKIMTGFPNTSHLPLAGQTASTDLCH